MQTSKWLVISPARIYKRPTMHTFNELFYEAFGSGPRMKTEKSPPQTDSSWHVYMVRCRDNTLYTGITNDLEKRVAAHNGLKSGAKYTRSRRPVRLVYWQSGLSRSEAAKLELFARYQCPQWDVWGNEV